MESNKRLRSKKTDSVKSPSYLAAAVTVFRRPSVCAFDLPGDLSLEDLAELRPLCGFGCEDSCPYAC